MSDGVLQQMVDETPWQEDDLTNQINTLIDKINESQEKINHIKTNMMDVIAFTDLSDYLDQKKNIIPGGMTVTYGPDYGVMNVTDWTIDSTTGLIIYEFMGIGWDGDTTIIDYINKWNWAYDYLERPAGLTGTYGLKAQVAQLQTGVSIQTLNKNKIAGTPGNMGPYAS